MTLYARRLAIKGAPLSFRAVYHAKRRYHNNEPSLQNSEPVSMAVLDDYQNLSTPHLAKFSPKDLDITVFPDTIQSISDANSLVERLRPFKIISTMRERTPLSADIIQNLPNLRLVLTTGIRNHSLDIEACKRAGVVVGGTTPSPANSGTTPIGYGATSQHTWALILSLANNVLRDHSTVTSGGWQRELPLATCLSGQTFACLGLGRLGTVAAQIAHTAFGMRVIAWSNSLTQQKADEQAIQVGLPPGSFTAMPSKATLFEAADVLSVHYVLSPRSRNIVSASELALMKPTAFFVNTSRGPLVDEDALFDTLNKGKIRGAALDVFWVEPLPVDSRWRTTQWGKEAGRSDLILTPHTGFVSTDTMDSWWGQTSENLGRWLKGETIVNRLC